MKTITPAPFNVYTFNELTKDAQQVAYDSLKDFIIDDRFNWFKVDASNSIEESYGLKDVKVFYSLSSSQGDGFSFKVKMFNTQAINDLIMKDESVSQAIKDNITRLQGLDALNVTVNDNGTYGRYAYAARRQVEVIINEDYQDLLPVHIIDQIQEVYADVYMTIAKQYEKDGYNLYEVTLEDVQDLAESNDYEFYEDGRQY
jgi:hypothetical protein